MAKNQSHFQLRRDTNENWLKANPVLKSGEPGFVLDTGALKIGNGKDTFSALAEIAGGGNQGQGGATGDNNIAILNFDLELDPEDDDILTVSCDISKSELANLINSNKIILGVGTMSMPESDNGSLILPFYQGFSQVQDNEVTFQMVTNVMENQLSACELSYKNNNDNLLIGKIEFENEKPLTYYTINYSGSGSIDAIYFTEEEAGKIKTALKNEKIPMISAEYGSEYYFIQITSYFEKDNAGVFTTNYDGATFQYDSETNRYNISMH